VGVRPDISEFSYGYALTDELIHWHGTNITAAPLFPSLYQEGQAGGGYDVQIDDNGVPLFLQFKLADCMVRRNAKEVQDGNLICPFFRMHLRPRRHSNQHSMLLQLEAAGNDVWYSAPAFFQVNELNDAYIGHSIKQRSLWIRPSVIGPLPDDGDHHVAFQIPGHSYVYSDPRQLDGPVDFESFEREIIRLFSRDGRRVGNDRQMEELADDLYKIGQQRKEISAERKALARDEMARRKPLERIAFYASVYFGVLLFVVRKVA
jgi:hypothetical protein